ncbi:MAG: hypothetical protein M3N33_01535 [Actinomycetota bacterium]|nr:hypothetical protein [Actinomycetota bacterium]
MPEPHGDALSRLSWALRRYFWVMGMATAFALAVAAAGSAAFAPREPGTAYQARALVVATTLEVRTDQLPRLATAVFRSTAVARAAVRRGALPYVAEDLVPDYADIEPVEDNVVVFVDGTAHEPALAARVANAAAEALVDELNDLGPGVGTFDIHQRAAAPTRPVSEPAIPLPLVAGMAAGPLLGLGLIVLLTVVRQPVLRPSEAEAILGVPAVRVHLPRSWRRATPERVIGLSALVKTVFPEHRGMVVVFSCHADRQVPTLVSLTAKVLERYGPVQVVTRSSTEELAELEARTLTDGSGPARSPASIVAEGPPLASWDVPQFLPPTARALLVAPEGVPRSALRSALDQFLPHELAATAIVATSQGVLRSALRSALDQFLPYELAATAIVATSRRWRRRWLGTPSEYAPETAALTSEDALDQQFESGDGVATAEGEVHGGGDRHVSNDPSSGDVTRR